MATIRDVARAARVSTATVSAAITGSAYVSPALKARVMAAVEETGYAPDGVARSLRRGVAPIIGVIVSDFSNPFFAAVAHAVENAARAQGYAVLLGNTDDDPAHERTYLGVMRTQRAAGIILAITGAAEDAYIASLRAQVAVPAVLIDRSLPALGWDTVVTDNVRAAQDAVAHMAALGHRRIAYIGGSLHLSTNRERLEGYRRALAGAGIAPDPALECIGNSRREQAHATARALLARSDRPGAVFLANNIITVGVMHAVAELAIRCPEELSIAAIDDFVWAAAFRPQLTVVSQPAERIGTEAVRLLLERMKTPDLPPRALVLPGELVVRTSCAPTANRA